MLSKRLNSNIKLSKQKTDNVSYLDHYKTLSFKKLRQKRRNLKKIRGNRDDVMLKILIIEQLLDNTTKVFGSN